MAKTCLTLDRSGADLLALLKRCEAASRPICFETIDLILGSEYANKMVEELTGQEVDEVYRSMKVVQLENYLFALEDLAEHWQLIDSKKYAYRFKSHGVNNRDLSMFFPHQMPDAPYFSR